MKLYFVKQKPKRFEPLGLILAEYLNLNMNILPEKEIALIAKANDLIYFTDNAIIYSKIKLDDNCYLLGPDGDTAYKWNNKSYQANNLKDIVSIPEYKTYKTILEVIVDFNNLKRNYKKFIIFENVSDGGKRCHVCDEQTKSSDFFQKFSSYKGGFRVSKFINNVHNVSLHFVIADINKFWISPIVDQQIKNEVVFSGGIFPSIISNKLKDRIIEETSKVAEVLSKDKYVGLCHIDFMIVDDIIYFAEINPRKAGTTLCMSYMMENCFNYSIPIIEYYAIKEKRIVNVKQLKEDIPWKMSLIPYLENPPNNPGDERICFRDKKQKIIKYSEYYKTHSFEVIINDIQK